MQTLKQYAAGKTAVQVCKELGIHRSMFYRLLDTAVIIDGKLYKPVKL